MQDMPAVKQRIHQMLDSLPHQGLKDLSQFLDFLEYKYQAGTEANVVSLGGIWQGIAFDVSDEEVRALRQQVQVSSIKRSVH